MDVSDRTASRQNGASSNGNGRDLVDLLERDPELARSVGPTQPGSERPTLPTETMKLDRGSWKPDELEPTPDHLGFLVLEGLVGRRVLLPERGRSLELLGKGDIFRTWQEDSASFSEVSWLVLEPARIAVLSNSFVERARRRPELLEALTERALRRSRRLAVNAAITNTVGVEERLYLLLWQLTEIWGRMGGDGAVLPIRLSHQVLADLVGARRPTVTLALRALTERGVLRRGESGEWLLAGDPP